MPNILDKFNNLEEKHRAFINLIVKPLMTLIVFLSVGYYTLWLSTNYVKQNKFYEFVNRQIESDEKQDETAKARFEIVQTKLETIINQQTSFTEQMKTFNTMMGAYQKQFDLLQDRVLYLERSQRTYNSSN
jgi:hypothetical protein